MTIKEKLLESTDWLRVRLRIKPRCQWVQDHLGEYYTWDMKLVELWAIELHLQACPFCAKEWEETEQLLDQLRLASPNMEKLKNFSSEEFMADTIARIKKYEAEQAHKSLESKQCKSSWTKSLRSLLKIPRLASAMFLLLSVSALAYWSPQIWRHISTWPNHEEINGLHSIRRFDGLKRTEVILRSKMDRAKVGVANQPENSGKPITLNHSLYQILDDPEFNKQIESNLAIAQVKMLLPHTEAQWEDWARHEYPHIIWVYDALTEPEYGINWDGQPVNIPEWAKKVWTDEVTRPTGWRALVCYSGEILKFDCPETIDAPNVNPSIQAMKIASLVAGYDLRFDKNGKWPIPALNYADLDTKTHDGAIVLASFAKLPSVPALASPSGSFHSFDDRIFSEYANKVLGNQKRLTQILIYVVTTMQFIPGYQWRNVESSCSKLLVSFEKLGLTSCDKDALKANFHSMLMQYGRLTIDAKVL